MQRTFRLQISGGVEAFLSNPEKPWRTGLALGYKSRYGIK
jgi:hypothetical protein